MTNRRNFIKKSLFFVGGTLALPNTQLLAELSKVTRKKRRVCVLHTNDFHSHFEPFPTNHPAWPSQGGITHLGGLIQEIRKTEDNVLLFDCGDVFQGTPYFNFFEGKPELQWMERLGYHAGTLGNHDFDLGIDHLANLKKNNNIPLVNCNYNFNQSALQNLVKKHVIIQQKGVKIGVTGCTIDLEGLLTPEMYKGIVYHDPVEPIQKEVDFLRNQEKCDLVFVLSHLGYEYQDTKIDDIKLAQITHGIDAIMGGHTHTFLEKPTIIKNAKGKDVIVNQAAWAGLQLGKLVFEID
jgi:5'-nucleotidase